MNRTGLRIIWVSAHSMAGDGIAGDDTMSHRRSHAVRLQRTVVTVVKKIARRNCSRSRKSRPTEMRIEKRMRLSLADAEENRARRSALR